MIYDYIQSIAFDAIADKIKIHYGSKEIDEYEFLYKKLSKLSPSNIGEMEIFINVYQEHDEDTPIFNYDENDSTLIFDVSAYKNKDDTIAYSIASMSFSNFLGCNVDNCLLRKMSKASILAHCMYEITSYSFSDK